MSTAAPARTEAAYVMNVNSGAKARHEATGPSLGFRTAGNRPSPMTKIGVGPAVSRVSLVAGAFSIIFTHEETTPPAGGAQPMARIPARRLACVLPAPDPARA